MDNEYNNTKYCPICGEELKTITVDSGELLWYCNNCQTGFSDEQTKGYDEQEEDDSYFDDMIEEEEPLDDGKYYCEICGKELELITLESGKAVWYCDNCRTGFNDVEESDEDCDVANKTSGEITKLGLKKAIFALLIIVAFSNLAVMVIVAVTTSLYAFTMIVPVVISIVYAVRFSPSANYGQSVGTIGRVLCLIFCSVLIGILMLCDDY